MNTADLQPQRHAPPEGWPGEVFGAVTDALARALVAAVRRDQEREAEAREEAGR